MAAPGTPPTPKAVLTETLRNLQVAIKSSSLYSINHPTSVKSINTIFAQLQKMFEQKEIVGIQVTNGVVFFDRVPIDRENIHAKNFTLEVTERNVTAIFFQRRLTIEELRTLMRIMGMKASKVEEQGGLQKMMSAEDIQNIKVTIFSPAMAAGPAMPTDEDSAFGGMPLLPEMTAFANYFLGRETGLGGFESRFFSEAVGNPKFVAQMVARAAGTAASEEATAGEHPVMHYLRSLDRVASAFSARVGGDPEELKKVVIPVALSFDESIKESLLTEGREHVGKAGAYVSSMYQDVVSEIIADRVRFDYKEGKSSPSDLGEKALKLLRYTENPKTTVRAIEQKLRESGMSQEEIGDVLDHIYWGEYTLDEKVRRLTHGEKVWSKDFDKIYHTLVELLKSGKESQAVLLFRSYLTGLREPDEGVKRAVAANSLKLLEPFPKSDAREDLREFLAGELTGCLRAESAQAVAEAMTASVSALVRGDLLDRSLARAKETISKLDEMLLAFEIQPWKTELVKNGLKQIGEPAALQALVDALHPADGGRDEEAVDCVKAIGPSIMPQLIKLLEDEQDRVRRARIVEAVQLVGPSAEGAILAAFNDERWYVIRNLAILLGEIGGERSVFALEKVLTHTDVRVSRAAVRSLGKIASSSANRVLGRALERGNEELRSCVIQTCAVPGNNSILPQLLDIVKSKSQQAGSDAIRKRAIDAVGKIGAAEAVPVLREILERRSLFSMAEDVDTRLAIVQTLGTIGGEAAIDALQRAASKDPKEDVRSEAERFLDRTEPS